MKPTLSILVFSAILSSTSVFAGSVTNEDQSKNLSVKCLAYSVDQSCGEYSVQLSEFKTGEEKEISRFKVEKVTNSDELFKLDEAMNRFQITPVANRAYDGDSRFGKVGGIGDMAMAAAPVGYVLFRYAGMYSGMYLTYAGFVVAISPLVADVASLPVRAAIYGAKWRQAKRTEHFAYHALQLMMDSGNPTELKMKNKRFERVIHAFESVNADDGEVALD
jgi:hypothetical protein